MAESPTIDYKIAFEEVSLLNKLFSTLTDYLLPALNPNHYEVVESDGDDIIIEGLRSGLFYRSTRAFGSFGEVYYTGFLPVKAVDRTVTEWVSA